MDAQVMQVYRTMRMNPDWSGDRVAASLGLSPATLSAAVGELSRLGLATPAPGADGDPDPEAVRPGPVTVFSPETAFARLVEAREATLGEALARSRDLSRQVADLLECLDEVSAHSRLHAGLELLEGNEAVGGFLAELEAAMREEVLALHTGGKPPQEVLDASLEADRRVRERGVAMRAVYLTSVTRHGSVRSYLEALAAMGIEIRVRATLPFRMIIVDRSLALCSLNRAEGRAGAVVVRTAPIISLLVYVFNLLWTESEGLRPPEQPAGRAVPHGLAPEQLTIVRLLHEGSSDHAIARALGVTERTVTRKIREVFDTLGVETRFQAGVAAHDRGLL